MDVPVVVVEVEVGEHLGEVEAGEHVLTDCVHLDLDVHKSQPSLCP